MYTEIERMQIIANFIRVVSFLLYMELDELEKQVIFEHLKRLTDIIRLLTDRTNGL